jgi:hypothetical protein
MRENLRLEKRKNSIDGHNEKYEKTQSYEKQNKKVENEFKKIEKEKLIN